MSTHSDDHSSFQEPKPLTAPQTQAALDFTSGSPLHRASNQAVAGPSRHLQPSKLQVNATLETTPRALVDPSTSSSQHLPHNPYQTMVAYSRTAVPQTAVPVSFFPFDPAGSYPTPVAHGYQNFAGQHLEATSFGPQTTYFQDSLSSIEKGKRKTDRDSKPYQRPPASRKGKEPEVELRQPQKAAKPFYFKSCQPAPKAIRKIGYASQVFHHLKRTHPGIKGVHTLFMVPPGVRPFNGAWRDSDQYWQADRTALQSKFALLFFGGSIPVRLNNPDDWVRLIRLFDCANTRRDGVGKSLELAITPSGDVVEVHYPVYFSGQYACTMPFPPTTPFHEEHPDLTSRDLRLEIPQMDIVLDATHDGSSNQPAPTPPELTLFQLAAANEAEARRKAIEEEASYGHPMDNPVSSSAGPRLAVFRRVDTVTEQSILM